MSGRVHFDVGDRSRLPSRLKLVKGLRGLTIEGGEVEADKVVAIIGTREASPIMLEAAKWIATSCVENGWVVASGGALGIDAAAHEGTLATKDGVTWAILPTGCELVYPPAHKELYQRIVQTRGRLVWPFPPNSGAYLNFHERNRVVAEIADAVIIVEAPHDSGTKSTAKYARRARKPIWVVPSVPWADCGGNGDEIGLGGRPLHRMENFFQSFEPKAQSELPFASQDGDGEREQKVLGCLGDELKHPDELVFETGLSFAVVSRALLTLSLDTVVVVAPDGRYRRCH